MRQRVESVPSLLALATCAAMCISGCTHVQLRKSTIRHSMTLSDIYTQQVLNNVAMFVQNPDALPFFAFPNQGTTQIQDTGNVGNFGYKSTVFSIDPFILNGSRVASENWVLVPISDAGQLRLMRCAYQQAISSCIGRPAAPDCVDCGKLRSDFFGPTDEGGDADANLKQRCLDGDGACWFGWGCGRHVPDHCKPPYVGAYGDLYVWVPPAGRAMLTKLTLHILDYATNPAEQYEKRTKEVVLYLSEDGTPTTQDWAKKKITAYIPIDQPSSVVAALDNPKYAEFVKANGKYIAKFIEVVDLVSAHANMTPTAYLIDLARVPRPTIDMLASLEEIKSQIQTNRAIPPRVNEAHLDTLINELKKDQNLSEGLNRMARLINDNHLILPPGDISLEPVSYQRRPAASEGLQLLFQRLSAASPRG